MLHAKRVTPHLIQRMCIGSLGAHIWLHMSQTDLRSPGGSSAMNRLFVPGVMRSLRPRCAPPSVPRTRRRSCPAERILRRVSSLSIDHPKDVTPTRRECLQEAHAVVHPHHPARQPCRPTPLYVKNFPRLIIHEHERARLQRREPADVFYKTAPDQPRIRDGVMGDVKRAGGDHRRAVAGEAGDAVDTGGLNGRGEGHRRQDGGEPPGQPRRACPREAEQEEIMGRTPASRCASPELLWLPLAKTVDPLWRWDPR
jgi:hypothetical protein